jgi:MazG family protein
MADPRVAERFAHLVDVMARLRAPGGCPWDREQTPETLRPYLLEEVYEVLEALDRGDSDAIRDELGDLLLQVVFHAQLASEDGRFDVADVAHAIATKLVRRHPHVFGDVTVRDADEVVRNWRRIKAEERRAKGHDDDPFVAVPRALPALARAQAIGEKGAQVGLDWDDVAGVLAKVREEVAELEAAVAARDRGAVERELGDLLLALSSIGRHQDVSAELALDGAITRFLGRARDVIAAARARGKRPEELSAAARDALWAEAKARTPAAPR